MSTRSEKPVFFIALAVRPTLPELCGSTSTMEILALAGGLGAFGLGLLLRPIVYLLLSGLKQVKYIKLTFFFKKKKVSKEKAVIGCTVFRLLKKVSDARPGLNRGARKEAYSFTTPLLRATRQADGPFSAA